MVPNIEYLNERALNIVVRNHHWRLAMELTALVVGWPLLVALTIQVLLATGYDLGSVRDLHVTQVYFSVLCLMPLLTVPFIPRDPLMFFATRLIKGQACVDMAAWMAQYDVVESYVAKINAERAVTRYDYMQVRNWVNTHQTEIAQREEAQACKQVQGFA